MESKYLSFLSQYRNFFGKIEGIDKTIVESIEKDFNVKLPSSYKEYLFLLGKESGNLLGSYYTEYPSLLQNRNDAIYAINFDDRRKEIEKPLIKNSYFFFAQWQGYIFYFFDCDGDDDNPPVFTLSDSLEIEKYKDTFADFIYEEGLKPIIELRKL